MNEEDRKAAQKFARALRQFRIATDLTIPSQMVQAFLQVGLSEGCALNEIAQALKTNNSTASRHLLDLGERNRKKEPGYQLISSRPDPMNLRANCYALTPKGRLLFNTIIETMKE